MKTVPRFPSPVSRWARFVTRLVPRALFSVSPVVRSFSVLPEKAPPRRTQSTQPPLPARGLVVLDSGNGKRETGNGFSPLATRNSQLATFPRLALLALLLILSLGATDSDTRFNQLGHKLMCTCGCGQVLLECNHVGCEASDRMRRELTAAMQRGGSDTDVLNWFVQKYGPVVLAAPTKTGFNRVAWIMPYAALALGLALTIGVVRAWKSRQSCEVQVATGGPNAEMDSLRRRIDEETRL